MRLGQVVLVAMVALLACSIGRASANKNEVVSTTATIARNLLSFLDVDKKSPTKEERASTGVVPGSEGGRTGAGTTVVTDSTANGGGTITVTVYSNNGLWQRIKRWWLGLFSQEDRASSGVVAGEGGRTGAGGTVVTSNNNNGGGTVTVTIFNNNGLFTRVKKWWKNLIGQQGVPNSRRLR
ncbi:hypothetical protein PRIC1_011796 [Phytophthora ramorum]|uniref:RxLR effector protein n=1 Tax=Phytophthora ramorum TaxID=164328 RepID=H3GQQ1_PHYRM|nr:hypothetical protein KRP23_1619 [Phytophthora ramorum]